MSDTPEYTAESDEVDEQRSGGVQISDVEKGKATKQTNLKLNTSPATTANIEANEPKSRKRYAPLKPDELYVDWANDQLISHSRWGQDKLYRFLPVVEMDKLVGWATHLNNYKSILTTNHGGEGCTISKADSRDLPKSKNNPFLGLPNIPLRPTLLKHLIHDPATKLALAKLDQIGALNRGRKRPKSSCFFERFQHSAAVAVGMLAEEMITASLLPLARQHVARCRRLDNSKDWTLPPEEAIYKLLQDSDSAGTDHPLPSSLLTARNPTRSSVPGVEGTPMSNQLMPGERENNLALDAWCRSRDVDPELIYKDDELFGLLLPIRTAPMQQQTRSAGTKDPNPTIQNTTLLEDGTLYKFYEI